MAIPMQKIRVYGRKYSTLKGSRGIPDLFPHYFDARLPDGTGIEGDTISKQLINCITGDFVGGFAFTGFGHGSYVCRRTKGRTTTSRVKWLAKHAKHANHVAVSRQSSPIMPSAGEKKYPIVLLPPKQNINADLGELWPTMPLIQLTQLATSTDEGLGHRILVGLKVYKYFEPNKPFSNYEGKDISYALTKYSTLQEDVNVNGYLDLSATELDILDNWVSVFLLRFTV
ncbi:hypothetical protein B0H10DRAFT_1949906 [Mycena sp. CBHHK59/15]|nr:hypothetical protein B0H10DRAFT_1949906 [Mycena sp. CBHHK59/15]